MTSETIEFMLNYGWAILVVLIVIATLSYFDVFDFSHSTWAAPNTTSTATTQTIGALPVDLNGATWECIETANDSKCPDYVVTGVKKCYQSCITRNTTATERCRTDCTLGMNCTPYVACTKEVLVRNTQ